MNGEPTPAPLTGQAQRELRGSLGNTALSLGLLLTGISGLQLNELNADSLRVMGPLISGYAVAVLVISTLIVGRARRHGQARLGWAFLALAWGIMAAVRLLMPLVESEALSATHLHLAQMAGAVALSTLGAVMPMPGERLKAGLFLLSLSLIGLGLLMLLASL